MSYHEIWAIESEGDAWKLKESSHWGLARTINMADRAIDEHNWYAVAICRQGGGKHGWIYLNCPSMGSKKASKKISKYNMPPLPMEGNPEK